MPSENSGRRSVFKAEFYLCIQLLTKPQKRSTSALFTFMTGGRTSAPSTPIKIGVTGISTSGKTTVAAALIKQCNCAVVAGDDFYIREDTNPKVKVGDSKFFTNWDDPRTINWDNFHNKIEEQESEVVLVDSFQLFYSPKISNSLDAAIIIEYAEDEFPIALERRCLRHAHTHTPANYRNDIYTVKANFECCYFEDIVWKSAFENREFWDLPSFSKPILRLRATSPIEENIESAVKFVREMLDERSDSQE